MSPNYWKCKKAKQLQNSLAGVRARERKRAADVATLPGWRRVRTLLLAVWAGPDGRSAAIYCDGEQFRCGSERAVRGALAKMLWGDRK